MFFRAASNSPFSSLIPGLSMIFLSMAMFLLVVIGVFFYRFQIDQSIIDLKEGVDQKKEIAKEAQQAIIDVLLKKTLKAAKDHKVKSVILSGGVAANEELRRQLKKRTEREGFVFLVPDKKYCTDNAAMIAAAAYFRILTKTVSKLEKAEGNLKWK